MNAGALDRVDLGQIGAALLVAAKAGHFSQDYAQACFVRLQAAHQAAIASEAMARRDWAVRVLDAHPTERGWEVYPFEGQWRCGLGIAKQFTGRTPDEARAKAAAAIEAGEV